MVKKILPYLNQRFSKKHGCSAVRLVFFCLFSARGRFDSLLVLSLLLMLLGCARGAQGDRAASGASDEA